MTFNSFDHLSMTELIQLSKQLDERISTLQAELRESSAQQEQAPDPLSYYIILGPYTHEPYEVEPLGATPRGRQVFKINAPEKGSKGYGRDWNGISVSAKTLERAHAKAERKIEKRDRLHFKNREAKAWVQRHVSG